MEKWWNKNQVAFTGRILTCGGRAIEKEESLLLKERKKKSKEDEVKEGNKNGKINWV